MVDDYDFHELLAPIRKASLEELRDLDFVEGKLLPALGLAEDIQVFCAAHLQPFVGQGLRLLQWPVQFAPYLIWLSHRKIQRYAEIGVRHGGSFIVTVEYLHRFNFITHADAVDIDDAPMLRAYCETNPNAHFLVADSHSPDADVFLADEYDLGMIDGDHSYEGALADYELLAERCRLIALNDTHNRGWPGVDELFRQLVDDAPAAVVFGRQAREILEVRGRHGGFGVIINHLEDIGAWRVP